MKKVLDKSDWKEYIVDMKQLKEERFDKDYKTNWAERLFVQRARDQGWLVTKRGYPDFICYKGHDIMLVEVKRKKQYRLKASQFHLMGILGNYGVKCYKWSPDNDWLENGRTKC